MKHDPTRRQLLALLEGGQAHVSPAEALEYFPAEARGRLLKGAGYTPWQLLEHLRITQWDILEFSRNPHHESPPWPEGYWPSTPTPPSTGDWDASAGRFLNQLEELKALVADPAVDLLAPFPHGDGQNLLREALLAADHNAWHLGQLVLLRKQLGAWPARASAEGG